MAMTNESPSREEMERGETEYQKQREAEARKRFDDQRKARQRVRRLYGTTPAAGVTTKEEIKRMVRDGEITAEEAKRRETLRKRYAPGARARAETINNSERRVELQDDARRQGNEELRQLRQKAMTKHYPETARQAGRKPEPKTKSKDEDGSEDDA